MSETETKTSRFVHDCGNEYSEDRVMDTGHRKWWMKRVPMVGIREEWEAYFESFMEDKTAFREAYNTDVFKNLDKTVNFYAQLGCEEVITKAVWDLVEKKYPGLWTLNKEKTIAYLISKVMVCRRRDDNPLDWIPDSFPDGLKDRIRDSEVKDFVVCESFEESKEEHDRSLQAWLKYQWICDAKEVNTEVILLGKAETMEGEDQSKWIPSHIRGLNHAYHSYHSWITSEEEWKQSDDASALRICVMIEPAKDTDEMESAYRIARKRGMVVLLLWKHKEESFSVFMNTSLDSESDSDLFDDSDASIQTQALCTERDYDGYWYIPELICDMISTLRTGFVNDEAARFYQTIGLYEYSGWWLIPNRIEFDIRCIQSLIHLCCAVLCDKASFKDVFGPSMKVMISPKLDWMLLISSMSYQSESEEWWTEPNCLLIKTEMGRTISFVREYVSGIDAEMQAKQPKCMRCTIKDETQSMQGCLTYEQLLPFVSFNPFKQVYLQQNWIQFNQKFVERKRDSIMVTAMKVTPIVPLIKDFVRRKLSIENESARVLRFLKDIFEACSERIKKCDQHWVIWMDSLKDFSKSDRLEVFRTGLLSAGIKNTENPRDDQAWQWAKSTGDADLIREFKSFEKSLKSSSTIEEEMASQNSRWAMQSEHFVTGYLMKVKGRKRGEQCIDLLREALDKLIDDRGDFTAVDLVGLVWYSSKENRESLSRKLMMAMQTTLDYDTVHKDKVGWHWAREVVLKHPLWLCEDVLLSGEDEKISMDKPSADGLIEMKDSDLVGDCPSEIGTDKRSILFDRLVTQVQFEVDTKGGTEIRDEMTRLVRSDPENWLKLRKYQPKEKSDILRQDGIEGGPQSKVKKEEMDILKVQTNTLDMNIEKEYDTKAFLTEALTNAYLVNAHFHKLMTDALKDFGDVKFGPVKQASRVEPKSEEYASEKKPHCYWPYSACVIDLVRCSVTVSDLSEMVQACRGLESFIADQKDGSLSICRCKNGFSKYKSDTVPDSYTDVKFNVACKSEDGMRAIIGEVQILLKCILDAKQKAHELYEVTRQQKLFKNAAKRLELDFSFSQQLLLTGGNERLLVGPLTLTPFLFSLDHIDFAFLFRADFKSSFVIHDLAKAIVDESNSDRKTDIVPAILDCFSKFSDGRSCFGRGSGSLMTAIVQKAQPDLDVTRFFNEEIIGAMKKHKLDMGVCFNLFMDLPHSDVKSQIKWDNCLKIEKYDHLPPTLNVIVQVYDGMNGVESFDNFIHKTHPTKWNEFSENSKDSLIRGIQRCFDVLRAEQDYQNVSEPGVEWVDYIIELEPELASAFLSRADEIIQTRLRNTGQKSLTVLCDYLESIPKRIRQCFFQKFDAFGFKSFEGTDAEIRRFQQFNPTVQGFGKWRLNKICGGFDPDFFTSKTRFCFPEIFLVSALKRKIVFTSTSDYETLKPESSARFFGDERSEECRSMMVAESVTYFVNRVCKEGRQYLRDLELLKDLSIFFSTKANDRLNSMIPASDAAPFILRLLPNKEWPFWSAMLESGDIMDESSLRLLSEVQMPEVNKSGSVEDYREWQQRVKSVRYLSDYLRKYEWPLHSAMGVIGDSMRVLQAVIDAYQRTGDLDPSHLDLAMFLRADWESEEDYKDLAPFIGESLNFGLSQEPKSEDLAAHMAGFICESFKIRSAKEMSDVLIQHIDKWLGCLDFGMRSGLLISQLFYQATKSASSSDSSNEWMKECVKFVSHLQRNPVKLNVGKLVNSLPESVKELKKRVDTEDEKEEKMPSDLPFERALQIIGDSVEMVELLIERYEHTDLSPLNLDLVRLLRLDWASEETATRMALFVCESLKFASLEEVKGFVLGQIDRWPGPIPFGQGSGLLMAGLQRAWMMEDSTDDSKSEIEAWALASVHLVDSFLYSCDPCKLRLADLSNLLLSLPECVRSNLSRAATQRIRADTPAALKDGHTTDRLRRVVNLLADSLTPELLASEMAALLRIQPSEMETRSSVYSLCDSLFRCLGQASLAEMDLRQCFVKEWISDLRCDEYDFPELLIALEQIEKQPPKKKKFLIF